MNMNWVTFAAAGAGTFVALMYWAWRGGQL